MRLPAHFEQAVVSLSTNPFSLHHTFLRQKMVFKTKNEVLFQNSFLHQSPHSVRPDTAPSARHGLGSAYRSLISLHPTSSRHGSLQLGQHPVCCQQSAGGLLHLQAFVRRFLVMRPFSQLRTMPYCDDPDRLSHNSIKESVRPDNHFTMGKSREFRY
jgi:hypothetical protein